MAWYDKYTSGQASMMGGHRFTPEQALAIRKMEFEQQMKEQKERDKYIQKMERRERRRNRKPISKRMGPKKRASARVKRPWKNTDAVAPPPMYTYDGKPIRHHQVGMSGAPQFQNLAQMGFQSPQQMGFGTRPTPTAAQQRRINARQDAITQGIPQMWMDRWADQQRKDKD